MIASPGLRNPGLGLGLGLGQVYPGLRNPGEATVGISIAAYMYYYSLVTRDTLLN